MYPIIHQLHSYKTSFIKSDSPASSDPMPHNRHGPSPLRTRSSRASSSPLSSRASPQSRTPCPRICRRLLPSRRAPRSIASPSSAHAPVNLLALHHSHLLLPCWYPPSQEGLGRPGGAWASSGGAPDLRRLFSRLAGIHQHKRAEGEHDGAWCAEGECS